GRDGRPYAVVSHANVTALHAP
ncbi:MAG: hypothetical protein QOE90_66, partial [Thermoplasmata archaeon]|nr:hypothetical protein [Thermoplasmata archaeon]